MHTLMHEQPQFEKKKKKKKKKNHAYNYTN